MDRRILAARASKGVAVVDPRGELRLSSSGRLTGYAVVFDARSEDLGGFVETFLDGSIELAPDVVATFNHNLSNLLGRTASGTLELTLDDHGLRYAVELPATQVGRDVRELVARGDVSGSSFTFDALEDDWTKKNGETLRTVKRAVVHEVGPVPFPAYSDTSAAVRSLEQWRKHEPGGDPPLSRLDAARRRQRAAELLVWRADE